jgi:hypothetical protein
MGNGDLMHGMRIRTPRMKTAKMEKTKKTK